MAHSVQRAGLCYKPPVPPRNPNKTSHNTAGRRFAVIEFFGPGKVLAEMIKTQVGSDSQENEVPSEILQDERHQGPRSPRIFANDKESATPDGELCIETVSETCAVQQKPNLKNLPQVHVTEFLNPEIETVQFKWGAQKSYSFNIHKIIEENVPKAQRSQSVPISRNLYKLSPRIDSVSQTDDELKFRKLEGKRRFLNARSLGHRRECLARALQEHVTEIVECLMYREGDAIDIMISKKCMTEEEGSDIRQRGKRRDQARILLSLIHGRDLRVLERFLEYINSINSVVGKSIKQTRDRKMQERQIQTRCAFCRLKANVDIKCIAEALWSCYAMSTGLYNEIIYSDKPHGAQGYFWNKLAEECDTKESTKLVQKKTLECLAKKGQYSYIANVLRDNEKCGAPFACLCGQWTEIHIGTDSTQDGTTDYPSSVSSSSISPTPSFLSRKGSIQDHGIPINEDYENSATSQC